MVIQGKNVTHIHHQELRLLMNYTNTGKGWVFLFGFFFCEILGQHYLRQAKTMEATSKWNQSHVHKKNKIKPKSATQASLSLKIKTKSSKFSITHFNKNANWLKGEITVNSHWARFSALDVRQTFRSLFQSVVKLRFRSIPGIYIWKKQL